MEKMGKVVSMVQYKNSHIVGYDVEILGEISFYTVEEMKKELEGVAFSNEISNGCSNASLSEDFHVLVENPWEMGVREMSEEEHGGHSGLKTVRAREILMGCKKERLYSYEVREDGGVTASLFHGKTVCKKEPLYLYEGKRVDVLEGVFTSLDVCPVDEDVDFLDGKRFRRLSFSYLKEEKLYPVVVSVAEGVRVVSLGKFSHNPYLVYVRLPVGLEEIGCGAFVDCRKLRTCAIPSSVVKIGESAFKNTDLREIEIPEGVEGILAHCFANCKNLEKVVLPSSLRRIWIYGFYGTGIGEIHIPEGVEEIGEMAFQYCGKLEKVSLPSTLRKIGIDGFNNTGISEIVVPYGVEDISNHVFGECRKLEKVTLPESVKRIGDGSFWETGVKEFVIPEGVESIGVEAFMFCNCLEKLVFPSTLKRVEKKAFLGTGMVEVEIPEGVEELSWRSFVDCVKLERVYLSAYLKEKVLVKGNVFSEETELVAREEIK